MSRALQNETLMVADDYLGFCVGVKRTPPSESAKAMRSLAKEIENTQRTQLHSLVQAFLVTCGPEPWTGLKRVMVELVSDGKLNWGRVVSLFAFTGVLASELYSRGEGVSCIRRLAEIIAEFLNVEKQEWLIQNGGWGGFTSFFQTARSADQESSMRKALYAAAGLGIAGITFLLVR